jgi:spore maturation protein SpmA
MGVLNRDMLNAIWLGLVVAAVFLGGFSGRLPAVTEGAIRGAETAVTLALGLVGVMALWLGIMRLAEKAGLVQSLASFLRPVMRRLFPDVPIEHPAMGSMLMNIAANMLGLNNAATPLGIRAMKDLEQLNPHPGTATNAMCTFLAINTSSVQLIPVTAIAILAAAKSVNPTAIIGTAFLATICSTVAGIIAVKSLERVWRSPAANLEILRSQTNPLSDERNENDVPAQALNGFGRAILLLFVIGFCAIAWILWRDTTAAQSGPVSKFVNVLSVLAIPFLLSFVPLIASLKKIKVYEEFTEGAKEGFAVALKIIPFLTALLVAISMFRGGGGIELIGKFAGPFLNYLHFPSELLPISLMRPLSGSGSLGILSELVKQYGPDHIISRTAATLFGSTETTFYVIAVYFGAVNIRRTRHAVPAGLISDFVGMVASVLICRIAFT